MTTVSDIVSKYQIKSEARLTRLSKWPNKDPEGSMDEFAFTLTSPKFKMSGPYKSDVAHRVLTMREFPKIRAAYLPAPMQSEIGAKLRTGPLRLMDYQKLLNPRTNAEAKAANAFNPVLPSTEDIFAAVMDDAMSVEGCYDVDEWVRMYYGPTTKIAEVTESFNNCSKWNRALRAAFGNVLDDIYQITRER